MTMVEVAKKKENASEAGGPGPYSVTPLVESLALTGLSPCRVFLKYEFTQPSGSFKSRGLGHLIKQSIAENPDKTVHFFSSSGGNAGAAVAYAARFYQAGCTVVLPTTSNQRMVEKIRAAGANLIIHGNQWAEADEYLRSTVMKSVDSASTLAVYCHPFDDPIIWEGHATMIDEIASQLPDVESLKGVVCSVGGGGLYNGIVTGLKANKLPDIPVLAIETSPAACLAAALEAGKVVKLKSVDTVAKSLAAQYVSNQTFAFANGGHPTKSLVISDAQALNATVKFAQDHGIIVEPACGAALAVAYENLWDQYLPGLTKEDSVVIVVCGGSATSVDDLIVFKKSLENSV